MKSAWRGRRIKAEANERDEAFVWGRVSWNPEAVKAFVNLLGGG
jgi:hypothetical protein